MHSRIAIAAALVLAVGPAHSSPLTEIITTPGFTIYYSKGDDYSARRVARAAEEHFARISADLGYTGRGPRIPIYLYPNHREFVAATGTDREKFTLGRAHSGPERIELDSQEIFMPLEPTTAHEVAHIIVFRIIGPRGKMPIWAHEGIAKFESGEWDDVDAHVLSEAVTQGTLIPLKDLALSFPNDKDALAYAESAAFFRYFAGEYGHSGLRALLRHTLETGSFDRAVPLVTGHSISQVERKWRNHLERQYSPYIWVRFLGTAALGALPILVILAFLAVRKKKKRLLARYDEEEWEAANWRDSGNA